MAAVYEPKRLLQQLREGGWPHQPLYKKTLKELQALARDPSPISEIAKRLQAYRISHGDSLSHTDPVSRIALQKDNDAFLNEIANGLIKPGTAFARGLLKAAQLNEKPKPVGHISVPVLILLAVIHSQEELQDTCLDLDALRNWIEEYQGRISDDYWRECQQMSALKTLLNASPKKIKFSTRKRS